jgi:hypothetical protein
MSTDYETFAELATKDGFDLDDPSEAVTLAAYVVGPNIKRIASFLGRPRWWCAEPARRLRENGVWRAGFIAVEVDDGPDGVELALQAAVAAGLLEIAA